MAAQDARPAPDLEGSPSARPLPRRPALARIAPFAAFMALLAAQPLLEGHLDGRWLVAARGVAVALLLALFWRAYSQLRSPWPGAAQWLAALATGIAVFLAWISFDSGWAAFEGGPGFDPTRRDGSLDPALVALRLFGLVLVVPVMEELFWRSFLMRWIRDRDFRRVEPARVGWIAFAISSALFASEHATWFAGLIAGFAYAALYMRTGNLWVPIISHTVTNGTLGIWILATRNWHFW